MLPAWMLAGSVRRAPHRRSLSPGTITSLTTGSSSNNSICAWESFSPPAPYFSIRISRKRSSSTRILSSAYCSWLFSCAMSSRSAGAEGMGAPITMGNDLTESISTYKQFMRQHVLLGEPSGTTACAWFWPDRFHLTIERDLRDSGQPSPAHRRIAAR